VTAPVGILVQGPLYTTTPAGPSTLDVLQRLAACAHRRELLVALAYWDDEDHALVQAAGPLVDLLVGVRRPQRAGSGNRHLQAVGVTAGLHALAAAGVTYVIKSRTDVVLSEAFLAHVLERAAAADPRLVCTTLITRWEPFHLSDILVAGTRKQLHDLFDPRPTYYEDAFSPEVQFARCYVRNSGLTATMRLEDWLRFLVQHVDLVDFDDFGLVWLKRTGPIRAHWWSRSWPYLVDRDLGPLLARPVSMRAHGWLRRTRMPPLVTATALRCLDPLAELVLRAVPFDVHERLGSPFHRYWVAPRTPEHSRPIADVQVASPPGASTGAAA
jgi:hypothetical protein